MESGQSEKDYILERERRKVEEEEGIERINNIKLNQQAPKNDNVLSGADFAYLMQNFKKKGSQSKGSMNFVETKKANIRRNEKFDREKQKLIDQKIAERIEKERVEWAPVDKEDAKFQEKMSEKMKDTGPT